MGAGVFSTKISTVDEKNIICFRVQLRRGGVERRGPHPHQRLHLLQAEGPQCGCASIALLQPQVRVRGAVQHRHTPAYKYTQDNVRKGHQGEKIGNIFLYL